jgi:dienelactone hydrolase
MKTAFLIILMLLICSSSRAELKNKTIEYRQGDALLEGYLSYDDSFTGKRPGILVIHEWMGLNDYAKMRADMLAHLGYVAFAADIYGKGVRPSDVPSASAESTKYKNDRPLLRARAQAGLDELRKQTNVDPAKLAAIGYCFGGTTALELARSGASIKGVVSFHGGLATPTPQDAKDIKAEVLVLHGADDPFVTAPEVGAFEDEMRQGNVRYRLIKYPNAVHGFTNANNKGELKGALYNAEADKASWQEMRAFLDRVLK